MKAHPQHGSVRVTATWQWSCVADHPEHGSGAIVRESPGHGSGAELRTTAVTEPEHARAPITEEHHLPHRCEEHESARVLGVWVDRHARGDKH